MKKIIFFIFILMVGCDSPQAPDCIKKTGKPVTKHYDLPPFDKVMISNRIQLFIKDSSARDVRVETGKNLLDEIELKVEDNRLTIKNHVQCNWVRGYKKVKVYVSAPQLKSIKNGSQFDVVSVGTLHYDSLELISEDWQSEESYHTDGDFRLKLDCKNLKITTNFISNFYLEGKTDHFDINIYSGDGRVEAKNLIVQSAKVYHRGTNDIILNPQKSVIGKLVSTGNLILVNRPPDVQVEALYKGRVIYE